MIRIFKIIFLAGIGGFVLGWLIYAGQRTEDHINTEELLRRCSIISLFIMAIPSTWYGLYFLAWLFYGPFDKKCGSETSGSSATDGGLASGNSSGSSGGDCGGGSGGCD